MKTLDNIGDNSIDFKEVSPDEIKIAQEISPADHAKNLEEKFGAKVESTAIVSPKDVERKKELLETLSNAPQPSKEPAQHSKSVPSAMHHQHLYHQEYTPEKVRDLESKLSDEWHDSGKASLTIGTLGLAGAGLVAYATAIGSSLGAPALLAAGLTGPAGIVIGIPALAIGVGAYKGYKLFPAWNEKRKAKKSLTAAGY
jgi:hypothetical protein